MKVREWHRPAAGTRLVAAAISSLLVALLLFGLAGRPIVPPSVRNAEPVAVTLWLPKPPTSTPPTPSPRRTARVRDEAVPPARARPTAASRAGPITLPATPQETISAQAAPASAPASAPLRLDSATLRRATVGVDGTVRRMARNSGQELDTTRPTNAQLLDNAVADTAIPDCLAPDSGGSLLSIPIIAVQAIRGKCK